MVRIWIRTIELRRWRVGSPCPPQMQRVPEPRENQEHGGVDRRWTIASCAVPDNRWLLQRSERSSVSDRGFSGTDVLRLIRISPVSARWPENNASRDGKFTRGQRWYTSWIEIEVLTVVLRVVVHSSLQSLTKYINAASEPRWPGSLPSPKTKPGIQLARYLCNYERVRGKQRKAKLPRVEGTTEVTLVPGAGMGMNRINAMRPTIRYRNHHLRQSTPIRHRKHQHGQIHRFHLQKGKEIQGPIEREKAQTRQRRGQ